VYFIGLALLLTPKPTVSNHQILISKTIFFKMCFVAESSHWWLKLPEYLLHTTVYFCWKVRRGDEWWDLGRGL